MKTQYLNLLIEWVEGYVNEYGDTEENKEKAVLPQLSFF
jgi:hypothetical protein